MAGSLNKVTLIGNVGRDPETKTFGNGGKVCNLSLATSESWTDKQSGEKKEKTEWHNVAVFNDGLISVIERFVRKGSKIYIEGKMQTRKYEKDGSDRYSTEVVLQGFDGKLILLGDTPKRDGGSDDRGGYQQREEPTRKSGGGAFADDGDLDDSIPF